MGRIVVGRFLEVAGMGIVLTGLLLGISQRDLVKVELLYCGAGILVFYLGYWLERGGRR